jgi:hypothetical protein
MLVVFGAQFYLLLRPFGVRPGRFNTQSLAGIIDDLELVQLP